MRLTPGVEPGNKANSWGGAWERGLLLGWSLGTRLTPGVGPGNEAYSWGGAWERG